jgi:glycerol-3-phosphate acyltransferase PlsY
MDFSVLSLALVLVAAYLLGSIPTGYLAGKWLQGIDMREVGSGSTGATNVLRTLGKPAGVMVLAIDVLKGILAIAIVRWVAPTNLSPTWTAWMIVLAGLLAILGHSNPIWLGFRGGKSVATSLGVLLAIDWSVALITLAVFLVTIAMTRIVSISSIVAALSLILWIGLLQPEWPYLVFAVVGSAYVIWRHRHNIQRLWAGTEPRLGQTLPPDAPSGSN